MTNQSMPTTIICRTLSDLFAVQSLRAAPWRVKSVCAAVVAGAHVLSDSGTTAACRSHLCTYLCAAATAVASVLCGSCTPWKVS